MGCQQVVAFTVPFVRGKGRPRFVRATGRAYTPDRTAEAMGAVRDAYVAAGGEPAPSGTPVGILIMTARPLPKSRPKRVSEERDTFKPDVDNIAKLVLDALTGVAWDDDTQVTDLRVVKRDRKRGAREETRVYVIRKEQKHEEE